MSNYLLDEFLFEDQFAEEVGRHPRSIERWRNQPDGLPYSWLGNRIIIHIPTARAWLLGRTRKPNRRRSGAAA